MWTKEYSRPLLIICIILMVLSCVAFVTVLKLIQKNNIDFGYRGYAVDSTGNIYIGRTSCIEVFQNGVYYRTIPLEKNRSYAFTIENDNILLSNYTEVVQLSLAGDEQSTYVDTMGKYFLQWQNQREFIDINGNAYKASSFLGWRRISGPNGVAYQTSPERYFLGLGIFLSVSIIILSSGFAAFLWAATVKGTYSLKALMNCFRKQ